MNNRFCVDWVQPYMWVKFTMPVVIMIVFGVFVMPVVIMIILGVFILAMVVMTMCVVVCVRLLGNWLNIIS